jgi:hypothetical protein
MPNAQEFGVVVPITNSGKLAQNERNDEHPITTTAAYQ